MAFDEKDFKNLVAEVQSISQTMSGNIPLQNNKIENLEKAIEKLVSKEEFAPVKLIAYGLATSVMTAVIMAILAKVIIK